MTAPSGRLGQEMATPFIKLCDPKRVIHSLNYLFAFEKPSLFLFAKCRTVLVLQCGKRFRTNARASGDTTSEKKRKTTTKARCQLNGIVSSSLDAISRIGHGPL